MKISNGVTIIGIATFLSFVIANISKGSDPGLGALILWFWPPILGILGIIIFLIICATTKSKTIRMTASIVWGTYLVYVGLGLYVDKGWPLVY
jgi:hypothetical protein